MLLMNRQHWNTPDEMHLRFSIIINLLYLKPVGLKCYHHPKPLKRAKTQRGRVRGETSNQSPAPKTPGHSMLEFEHCHSHPGWLKPSPTERQRDLLQGQQPHGVPGLKLETGNLVICAPVWHLCGCSGAPALPRPSHRHRGSLHLGIFLLSRGTCSGVRVSWQSVSAEMAQWDKELTGS